MHSTCSRDKNAERIQCLIDNGVCIPDPRQVYIDENINLEMILPESTLYPGVRLSGNRTCIGPRSKIGTEGPAVLNDVALAADVEVASGFITGSALLHGARAGANSHIRAGTILEEFSSTAHCVGLKQTILMAYVTTGSLINLCDILISGGRNRKDHTEIGSGFIHFNFTPWGSGDKATPTLVGDVFDGVFLNSDRIFLGGLTGVVGPRRIDYGSVITAGQIVRDDVPARTLYSKVGHSHISELGSIDRPISNSKIRKNLEYISNLVALKCWYQEIRLKFLPQNAFLSRHVIDFCIEAIEGMIIERVSRLNGYNRNTSIVVPTIKFDYIPEEPPDVGFEYCTSSYIEWVKSLSDLSRSRLKEWLTRCSQDCWEGRFT